MKKQILFIALVVICFAATSCQDDLTYSCDPELNKWAEQNITDIQRMTRSQFTELKDEHYQRAAYNAMTSQQRYAIWQIKLEEVLILVSEWSDLEKEHIVSLLVLMKNNQKWFDSKRTEEIEDQIHQEIYKWIDYAFSELHWDIEKIYAISGSPNPVKVIGNEVSIIKENEGLHFSGKQIQTRSEQLPMCTCHDGNVFSEVNCGQYKECRSGNCEPTVMGCGTGWFQQCDGMCYSMWGK